MRYLNIRLAIRGCLNVRLNYLALKYVISNEAENRDKSSELSPDTN